MPEKRDLSGWPMQATVENVDHIQLDLRLSGRQSGAHPDLIGFIRSAILQEEALYVAEVKLDQSGNIVLTVRWGQQYWTTLPELVNSDHPEQKFCAIKR